MTMKETGIYDKSAQTGVSFAFQIFTDKNFDFQLEDRLDVMVLDQMKIAVGPYLCGNAMAFITLILEIREVF